MTTTLDGKTSILASIVRFAGRRFEKSEMCQLGIISESVVFSFDAMDRRWTCGIKPQRAHDKAALDMWKKYNLFTRKKSNQFRLATFLGFNSKPSFACKYIIRICNIFFMLRSLQCISSHH